MRLAWFSPMPLVPSGSRPAVPSWWLRPAATHRCLRRSGRPCRAGTESAQLHLCQRLALRPDGLPGRQFLSPRLLAVDFRYPGLMVLHDAISITRGRPLLRTRRAADYRAELPRIIGSNRTVSGGRRVRQPFITLADDSTVRKHQPTVHTPIIARPEGKLPGLRSSLRLAHGRRLGAEAPGS
jgi:hypothetical protein